MSEIMERNKEAKLAAIRLRRELKELQVRLVIMERNKEAKLAAIRLRRDQVRLVIMERNKEVKLAAIRLRRELQVRLPCSFILLLKGSS